MRKLVLGALIVAALIASALVAFPATEIRQIGPYVDNGLGVTGDLRLGNTCTTSTGLRYYCGLNASHLSFFADNTVSLERLYRFATIAYTETNGYFLKSNGDNTFSWAAGAGGGSTTTLPWDNITGTDNAIKPGNLKHTGTPDNTMVPYWVDNNTFRWAAPAGSGTPAGSSGQLQYNDNGAFGAIPGVGYSAADNSITFPGAIAGGCAASDNNCGVTELNLGDAIASVLRAGICYYNGTKEGWECRNSDNTVTSLVAPQVKSFAFGGDNVVATDNVLLFRATRAMTLLRADCYASVDNVVGSLMECSTTNVTSCTTLDSWTVTNATNPFTDSSFTDAAVAAGAWLRWSTTSVGTTAVNSLTCTVQYRE